jgi:hypothetical protein
MRALACMVLALPVLIVATVADAQQRAGNKQMSDEVIAARRECFAEAKVKVPGPAEHSAGLATQRENAYRDCAQRKGIRP